MTQFSTGIIFEDIPHLLEWGQPIEKLTDRVSCKVENRGDRTVYYWGNHTILNGLHLDMTNSFWNSEDSPRYFNQIESWAYGDSKAETEFERISQHLIRQFGEPFEKDEIHHDRLWTWRTNGATITLHIFEQHAYKLCLKVRKG